MTYKNLLKTLKKLQARFKNTFINGEKDYLRKNNKKKLTELLTL